MSSVIITDEIVATAVLHPFGRVGGRRWRPARGRAGRGVGVGVDVGSARRRGAAAAGAGPEGEWVMVGICRRSWAGGVGEVGVAARGAG
ncbi:hypothetical protein [Corynebacterium bovis]|uniref:Uncharacterized protein n=1 Tax=Corynebacterium bovis TaxID=36808 RepID=A0A426PWJ2_9CORY|nr:hypothetical protein [Corynebacterium bovis]QQC48162.1 hypothetical protein I6I09_04525 [Corynebacterium bovis]RRO81839.1 hypothetical protein CXF36_06445 [Corynebacterium bovis]RRO85621.1 hypothetical protein CXF48_10080 [Corynebacterium bovis]RRO89460.1 hypothetical protein CXF30_03185 [Corynebacterium bovis]RRO90119.1 hypothetical protein CXF45_06375 [Corynebacterium bovis]